MTNLSKKCKLSEVYTNHSIRATGATILAKNMYCNAQIMVVTGHKYVQALSMYQQVDDEDKIRMGKTLTDNVLKEPYKTMAAISLLL
jgi:integrase